MSTSRRDQFFASLFDREIMRKRYPHRDMAFRDYLNDLEKFPLLTPQQEAALLVLAANGDSNAQQRLVEANLRLVITIAARFQGRGVAILDLIQEGNIGLLKAIRRFDPSKSERLSTYAKYPILSSIQRLVARDGTLIHSSYEAGEHLQTMKDQIATFEDQGIEPTPTRIAQSLNWAEAEVIELLDLMQTPLDLYRAEEGRGMLAERIAAPPMFLSSEVASPALLSDVREIISTMLTTKQRIVIENLFGLNDEGVVYTHREIAAKFFQRTDPRADVSVREIEKNAMARLRAAFEEKEA